MVGKDESKWQQPAEDYDQGMDSMRRGAAETIAIAAVDWKTRYEGKHRPLRLTFSYQGTSLSMALACMGFISVFASRLAIHKSEVGVSTTENDGGYARNETKNTL